MTSTEPQIPPALATALTRVRSTVASVAARTLDGLGALAQSSARIKQRDLLNALQIDMRRNLSRFQRTFDAELRAKVALELAPRPDPRRPQAPTDWQTLTLVDASEMDERLYCDRIGQQIAHTCEVELRELAAHMGALLKFGRADHERNPLRAELVGAALYRAIEAISEQAEARKWLVQELGSNVARAMPECYALILSDLQARGVQPAPLIVRTVEGPGNQLPGVHSGYSTLSSLRSQPAELAASAPSGAARQHSTFDVPGSASSHPADLQLMALLRRLAAVAGQRSGLGPTADSGASSLAPARAETSALMAVNLIRAHRDELVQAAAGKLDHMVIDVVASLFDQILADSRVPPQMARQIARLQLPMLRVALHDADFFTSRRHPVRRFVNRIASLACAFDDFDDGPGKAFLERVRELVQEIVEGDFDQIDLYASKLAALEGFIGEQTSTEAQQQGAASTLNRKESELRLQQRYMMQLQGALAALPLPAYLRDFLAQVWSQALVLAASRDGAESDRAQRYRQVGRELVMSVQPKNTPALRKKFLMALPPLMRDLHEGLQLIGWPAVAQRDFFSKLLPAHAESLKGQALSDLDHNMLVRQLDTVFNIAVPNPDSLSPADLVAEIDSAVIAQRFTADEARRVGLVEEAAVNWAVTVDTDTDTDTGAGADAGIALDRDTGAESDADTIPDALSRQPAPIPAEPSRGAALIEHIKLGFAYQMQLKDEWQKVRLTHVSAARSFFVFTTGHKHQETISMTARMVARMCESGRMRAVESAYLMERATQRARKQLAAMRAPGRL